MKKHESERIVAVLPYLVCSQIRYIDAFLATILFSHLLHCARSRATVYLLSLALRSQDVKLNDVSWDHYLINEPPLKRGSTKINRSPPWEPTHLFPCSLSSRPLSSLHSFFVFLFPSVLDSFVKSTLAMHMAPIVIVVCVVNKDDWQKQAVCLTRSRAQHHTRKFKHSRSLLLL